MRYKRWPVFAACLAILLGLCGIPSYALGPASGTMYTGLDVSEFQGSIDFSQVAAAGYEAVYIRAGWGDGNDDPYREQNYSGATAAGLKVGFYYYVTAQDTEQAVSQADAFVEMIEGKDYDMRPAMDFEEFGGLSSSEIREIGLAFLENVENFTHVTPIVYSDAYDAQTVWDGRYGAYPLWVADYEQELVPDNPVWNVWAAYQYTDSGSVPGIEDATDLDYYTSAAFVSSGGSTPQPTPSPGTSAVAYTVKPGDSFWRIATQFGISPYTLAAYNGLSISSTIYPGQILLVPVSSGTSAVAYTVKPGDSFWRIATQFGISPYWLAEYNGLSISSTIYPGQILLVPLSRPSPGSSSVAYIVQRGDSFWRIATQFGISPYTLAAYNGLSISSTIYPGQTLFIPL
jgi:lysozyme